MRSEWSNSLKNVKKAVSDGVVEGGFMERSACKEHVTISIELVMVRAFTGHGKKRGG